MNYFWAFVVGGGICVIGQLLIDLTGLTPARILTGYVVAGVILSAVGWYGPLAEFASCSTASSSGANSIGSPPVRDARRWRARASKSSATSGFFASSGPCRYVPTTFL